MRRTFLITGGAGFIGSNLVHHLVATRQEAHVVVLDSLTYAGNLENLAELEGHARFRFVQGDICDRATVRSVFEQYCPDVVLNLAAESHVDRSIDGPGAFVHTNIVGTFELLEAARAFYRTTVDRKNGFRFIQVSTDEVYGSLGPEGLFEETTRYAPSSPYSASKASADHLARAYYHTYGLPTIITNCSNNYGPYQFPEKLIPLVTLNAMEGATLPVYGDGKNVRDWLYVDDHAEALLTASEKGIPGETYCVGGNNERTNIEIVTAICRNLDELAPRASVHEELIRFVADRPGHDRRYAIDSDKIRRDLGWTPKTAFDEGIRRTVEWYLSHREWCERITQSRYRRERLGTEAMPAGAS